MEGDELGPEVDVELEAPTTPRRRRGLLAVNVAIVVAALAAASVLVTRTSDHATTTSTTSTASTTPSPEHVVDVLPASPIDGKQSQKLPVVVTPRTELVDGQVVHVTAEGFQPDERVGAVMCLDEAGRDGVDACDLGTDHSFDHVTYANATADGIVQVDVAVRQVIGTPLSGPVDCASAAERCIIAVGAVSDYDRSGGSSVGFVGQPAFPPPSLTISPSPPYAPGQVIAIQAAGMLSPREVQVTICRDDQCAGLPHGRIGPDGTFGATAQLAPAFTLADGTVVECADQCVIGIRYLGLPTATSAPLPPPVPISFDPTVEGTVATSITAN